jgi:DNA-binding MarR family transcriptional regulator
MGSTVPDRWHQLSPWQRDVLITLAVEGPQTGYALSGAVDPDVDKSSASRTLKELRGHGLVERTEGDHRQDGHENRLTTEGLALVHEAIVEPAIVIDQNG